MLLLYDLKRQYKKFKSELDPEVSAVLDSGHYILGPKVVAFEKEFANFVGARFSIGVASGTDAVFIALKVLGVTGGDEVITTPFTAPATIAAIVATGATVIFCDIDRYTYLMNIDLIPSLVTAKTKAIVAVHIFGNIVDIGKLRTVTNGQIPIVEDACQAHGSSCGGHQAGNLADISAFSFYPTKNLGGCGDGGMILTDDAAHLESARLLRQYGMVNKDKIVSDGYNSRLDEVQAAILSVKLTRLAESNLRRRNIADYYRTHLNPKFLEFQEIQAGTVSNFHVFSIFVKNRRSELVEFLAGAGIQTQIYYKTPLAYQPAHESLGYKQGDLPVLEEVCDHILAIPVTPELTDSEIEYIVRMINLFWEVT